jgi:hypothetical protein
MKKKLFGLAGWCEELQTRMYELGRHRVERLKGTFESIAADNDNIVARSTLREKSISLLSKLRPRLPV